jgi:chemotaxis protein CheY-P-specific phosphatase CheC
MKQRIEDVLWEASVKTFEDACFMYLMPELKDAQKKLPLEAAAEVKFKGDASGKLIVAATSDLFAAIAKNMLSSESPSPVQKKDALGEVANIICGNVIPSLDRKRKEGYKIYSPKFFGKDEIKKLEEGMPLAQITLNLNQGRADIKLFAEARTAAKEKDD